MIGYVGRVFIYRFGETCPFGPLAFRRERSGWLVRIRGLAKESSYLLAVILFVMTMELLMPNCNNVTSRQQVKHSRIEARRRRIVQVVEWSGTLNTLHICIVYVFHGAYAFTNRVYKRKQDTMANLARGGPDPRTTLWTFDETLFNTSTTGYERERGKLF